MDQTQPESNSHDIDGSPPSQAMQQLAIEALKKHPQYLAAASNSWCVPKVKLVPTHFVERLRWEEKEKTTARDLLKGYDHFILVSFFTAATPQEALTGSGMIYDFALHPKTMEVLHTSTSFWIS